MEHQHVCEISNVLRRMCITRTARNTRHDADTGGTNISATLFGSEENDSMKRKDIVKWKLDDAHSD
jgi:hypothetical protein